MNFSGVIGQAAVRRILTATADSDQLPNSFLFVGPEGVGKWAMALALAAYLNCTSRSKADSCGVCPPCRQIKNLQFPDLHIAIPTPPSKSDKEERENYWEILSEKIAEPYALITGRRQMSIPVAMVREIRRLLAQKLAGTGHRVMIIEQMDRMQMASADALLKLIEEPPPRTLIIVTSAHAERLPDTIVSRCRRIRFTAIPEDAIREYLVGISGTAEVQAKLLARLSQGSLGRALYLADDEVRQDREVAKLLFKGIFLAQIGDLITDAAELLPLSDRFRTTRVLAFLQSMFRDMLVLRSGAAGDAIVNIDYTAELERLAGRDGSDEALLHAPKMISRAQDDVALNVEMRSAIGALLADLQKSLR
jgi:DNA polymerase-3 subunit delta'